MRVPFLDVGATYTELADELDAAHRRVMERGWFVLGDELGAFEREFAAAVGASGACGVASGLDALTLSLRALGVGPGDEVIVPAMTFVATWLSVSATGATPVPAEPDPRSGGLDPEAAERAITDRTAAIVAVHLFGLPVDVEAVEDVSRRHGLRLVFDAAQAHGARYRERPIGAFGDASAWSFYPAKNLGAFGDGGAVTFGDPAVGDRVCSLRNYGSSSKYVHDEQGTNSRLDELQAALLRVKLRHLDAWNLRRRAVADRYAVELADLPLDLPPEPSGRRSAWHLYVVGVDRRDELADHLAEADVGTSVHYPVPPHRQAAYAELNDRELPVADRLAARSLSLPIGPHLTAAQVDHVVAAVRDFAW
ncbi:MAG: DegT/DnrJ/EryC1/StrS family aminotransferase [Actinomycetota bacterium]